MVDSWEIQVIATDSALDDWFLEKSLVELNHVKVKRGSGYSFILIFETSFGGCFELSSLDETFIQVFFCVAEIVFND